MNGTAADVQTQLAADGFALLRGVLPGDDVRDVLAEWADVCRRFRGDDAFLADADGSISGARNLLGLWPDVVNLARRPVLLDTLRDLLGPDVGVVRGLFFDKPPGRGWALPWHKDYNIAVRAHGKSGRFTKPTTKAGVPHVEAPADLLGRMVTARIHLDDMTDENGPLRVIPGSHRAYRTGNDHPSPPVVIHCAAGDVLLMRPLLTHASGHCDRATTRHRRIFHLECATSPGLTDGLEWHDFVRL